MNKLHLALLIIRKKLGEPEVNKLLETGKNWFPSSITGTDLTYSILLFDLDIGHFS
jgi:hypothetical protein